jgi:hypothetical protein
MNKVVSLIAMLAIIFSSTLFAQDSSNVSSNKQLLTSYLALKDALVAGNSRQAVLQAKAFQKAAASVAPSALDEGTVNKLLQDATKIAATSDIKKQRESFASFSTNMAALAKSVKLSDQPIYQAYCPMKKASWLTSQKAIKNPYYGSSMLTCGEITATFQ